MAYNIGLNVVEVDGSGAPAIVGAATSVAAFNIATERGVPNQAVRITSFKQFVDRFGSYYPGGLGAYLVKGFFDNGGQTAYVNRVVSRDAATGDAPAFIVLQDAANETLRLDAGYRGTKDPGTWGNTLYVKVAPTAERATRLRETSPASVTGTAIPATTDLSAGATLSVLVDGETAATTITLVPADFPTPTAATQAQIRDAINRKTTKLVASINANKIVITSTGAVAQLKRDFTSLQVTADSAPLGFTKMNNPTFGTPAPLSAGGTRLADISALQVGDAIQVTDGTRTALAKVLTLNPLTNDVTWTPAIANSAAFTLLQTTVSKVQFDLTIARGAGDADHIVETWTGLSMESDVSNYAPHVLNDPQTGSRFVVATDRNSPAGVGANVPVTLAWTRVQPGRDGTPTPNEFVGDAAAHTGFNAFDAYDVQLVTCERTDAAIVVAGLAYCAARGDCMYVGAVPQNSFTNGTAAAVTYGQAFQGKKVYGAFYGPWIAVTDPAGLGAAPMKLLPPVGHVMGVYARIETARGIWKAPAGDEANLLGVLDVEYRLSDTEHTDLVKNGCVNGIRVVPRSGVVIDASRTLSTDTRWLYVNVRLLFNYVKSSLKMGLRWARQEPNRDSLWNAIKFSSVTPFLAQLWRQGAFGTGTAEQTFTVICDATNNPPDQVDQGNLKIEVYFYPSKPAETIIIIVGQRPSGATASEA